MDTKGHIQTGGTHEDMFQTLTKSCLNLHGNTRYPVHDLAGTQQWPPGDTVRGGEEGYTRKDMFQALTLSYLNPNGTTRHPTRRALRNVPPGKTFEWGGSHKDMFQALTTG